MQQGNGSHQGPGGFSGGEDGAGQFMGVVGGEGCVDDDGGGRTSKRRPTLVGVGGEAEITSGGFVDGAHAVDVDVAVTQQADRLSQRAGDLCQLQGFFLVP